MEMSEELKRANREKELKHKLDKSSLDGIKKEIAKLEKEKIELEKEKDQIFQKYKDRFKEGDDPKVARSRETTQATPPNQPLNITFGQPIATSSSKQHAPPPTQQQQQQHSAPVPPFYMQPDRQRPPQMLAGMHGLSKAPGNDRNDRPPVSHMQGNVVPPPHSVASMVPTSLHHGLYGQVPPPQFFDVSTTRPPSFFPNLISNFSLQRLGLPPHSAPAVVGGSGGGGHRINPNARQPTPTSSFNSMQQSHIKPTSSYNKSMPMPPHPLSSMPGASGSQSMGNERERHRLYKRSHDQVVSSAQPPQPTMSLPPPPPPHLPYLPAGLRPMGPAFPPLNGKRVQFVRDPMLNPFFVCPSRSARTQPTVAGAIREPESVPTVQSVWPPHVQLHGQPQRQQVIGNISFISINNNVSHLIINFLGGR